MNGRDRDGSVSLIVLSVFEATLVLNEVNDSSSQVRSASRPGMSHVRLLLGKRFFFLLGRRFVLMGRQGANVPGGENKKALL